MTSTSTPRYEETRLGAENRMADARAAFAEKEYDYIVSIENGLVKHCGGWYDFAVPAP
jgi:non-canonical (house-cleaning) NTP pyrophosphatase